MIQVGCPGLEDYAAVVGASSRLRITGSDSKRVWRVPNDVEATPLDMSSFEGIVDFSPNDQVVNVRAGTRLADLQIELAKHGQCIPMVAWKDGWSHLDLPGTVAGSLSINLPHELEAECGSWRDWVLGTQLILADGTIAKTGSHAVKNVAGYDIHKLMIGARGTLALIAEVILRTYPIKSLPEPTITFNYGPGRMKFVAQGEDFENHAASSNEPPTNQPQRGETRVAKGDSPGYLIQGQQSPHGAKAYEHLPKPLTTWIQRVLPTDFERARQAEHEGHDIPATSTIVRHLPEGASLIRFPGDWIIRTGHIEIDDPTTIAYMKRAKSILDPTSKFNPGEFGFI